MFVGIIVVAVVAVVAVIVNIIAVVVFVAVIFVAVVIVDFGVAASLQLLLLPLLLPKIVVDFVHMLCLRLS